MPVAPPELVDPRYPRKSFGEKRSSARKPCPPGAISTPGQQREQYGAKSDLQVVRIYSDRSGTLSETCLFESECLALTQQVLPPVNSRYLADSSRSTTAPRFTETLIRARRVRHPVLPPMGEPHRAYLIGTTPCCSGSTLSHSPHCSTLILNHLNSAVYVGNSRCWT